ncbi:Hypothetical protein R9X50_00747400 [Acrodontium crateriforme]|uniref:RING-type domain-containing protein n=1 Tax=Acrodontium crateriforme TaxID=150365 RepID=A0AAQ3MBI7_9PEZI|nr:Hypothetical protein R9X50_00747400 [Acrodontium crateriforme]
MSSFPPPRHISQAGRSHARGHSLAPNFTSSALPPSNVRHSSSPNAPTSEMSLRGMSRLEGQHAMDQSRFLASKARVKNLNPPVDMRLLDYVAPYDGNLMCPICRCPFVDPVILTECDHCFCRDCIRQTWSAQYNPLGPRGDCPTCRTPAKLGLRCATSKILVNILDDLVVKCPRSEEGCPAEVKRGEVQDHVNIYCGYTVVNCPSDDCELPLRRKDMPKGCLHHGVCCFECREELQISNLERHWQSSCPQRTINCEFCDVQLTFHEREQHMKDACPALSIPCPGAAFGCTSRGRREQAETHSRNCTLARLAPIFAAQKQRLDEQEAAQKAMAHKLDIFQDGFASLQSLLCDPSDGAGLTNTQATVEPPGRNHRGRSHTMGAYAGTAEPLDLDFPTSSAQWSPSASTAPSRPAPNPPGPRPRDLPEPYTGDFDLAAPAFPSHSMTQEMPYTSPLHHLLSMHESLRDEMSRISAALAEVDGRLSMQSLNENMRTREEITYLGAQLAGLSRQVHWLTSSQLQRQQPQGAGARPANGSASSNVSDMTSVEAAVNAASNGLRGSQRMANGGNGMRRGLSEEGRTKL